MTATIAIAFGDGDSPQLMVETLMLLREAGAELSIETVELGARIYAMESETGILPSALITLTRTQTLLLGTTVIPEPPQKPVLEALSDHFALRHARERGDAHARFGEGFTLFTPREPTLTAMIDAAILLLEHIGQEEQAARLVRAVLEAEPKDSETIAWHVRKSCLSEVSAL